MGGDGLEISSLLGEEQGEHSCCSKRESLASGREPGGSAQGPGEGPACRGEWVHDPDDVFRIPLSKTAATSPVVTELLTCDSVELIEKLNS